MSKSRPNEFRVPSPGFSRVMGIWNTRDSVAAVTGISDIARIGKTPPARIHQRNSRKKALLRPQESASERNKRSSVQKWNAILTTTTQIVRANRQLRLKANRVRLQNIAAKKLKSMGDYAPPVHPKTAEDVELIQQALGNKFVFDELTPDELKPFVDAFCKVNFQKGDVLFQQGDPGKHFYIVCQGQIEFNVGEKQVGIATRGASFGEVALLYTCPQAATTTVKENDACVFRVGQMCFRSILKLRTQRIDDEKAKLLEAMDCFEDVGKDDLRRLGEALVAVVYQEGDVLYSDEDDSGPPFCVVQEGQLKVADINLGGTKYDQMTLNEGDHCGDLKSMSMDLTDLVDSAYGTVTAVSKGLVYTIDRPTFQKVFGDVSRLVIKSLDKKKLVCAFLDCLPQCPLASIVGTSHLQTWFPC